MKSSIFKSVSLIALAAALGGTSMATSASAKSVKTKGFRVTKITKNTHYQKSAYTKKAPKTGVTIYSSRYLSKHTTSKKTKTFYSTQSVRVVKSTGKQATYRYVTNKSKTVKGWIWTGNLKGKQGKTTSVSTKTVNVNGSIVTPASVTTYKGIQPKATTNTKIAKKTVYVPLKKTSNVKSVSTDKKELTMLVDTVSDSNYKGVKGVATLRDSINKLGYILVNYPNAWDSLGEKHNPMNDSASVVHKDTYNTILGEYNTDKLLYVQSIKEVQTDPSAVKDVQADVNSMLKDAKY